MSSLKGFIKSVGEHIKDVGKDFKQFPEDIKDSVRNGILRQPQTLRDYNITSTVSQKELFDTLSGFYNSHITNIKNGIAENLLFAMDRKNFPINVRKTEKIYRETTSIDDLQKYEGQEIIEKIEKLLNLDNHSMSKEEIIRLIKKIFKESKDDALKTTKQKIYEQTPKDNDIDVSYMNNTINGWIEAINDAYEIVTNKFAIRAYQLLCHELENKDTQKSSAESAKEIFVQAKELALKQAKEYTLQKLTPQDIFSLQIYNYNSNFWNTHVKDGNNPKDLILFKPHATRPPKPDIERPKQPKCHEYDCVEDYEHATQERKKETNRLKRTPEYRKRNERTEKTEWMKDILKAILDVGPLNRLSNGIIKRISAVLERGGGAGVQHTIEAVFRPNILEMSPQEEELLRHILIDVKYGKKCFIVLNHETFANIPMTIVKFMQVAHEMGMENINEHFTTIIGPLLATHKGQNALLNSLSSILVTHPADNRIPGAKRISNHQQQNAGSQFEKDLSKDNPEGEIYFCAPSGTRDIVHYGDDGIPQIFIPDATWGSNITTGKLIRALHSQNPDLRIYAVSTNTTELKRPNEENGVSPNNNKRNKNATVSMHLQQIDTEDLSTENIINIILNGINYPIPSLEARKPSRNPIKRRRNKGKMYYDYDENGKINEAPCATPLPTIIFQYLKKFTKTPEYAKTGKLPERFFDKNGKLKLDTEEFKYLQEFSKTSEYSRIRKIPSRFFDKDGYIDKEILKNEIESKEIK